MNEEEQLKKINALTEKLHKAQRQLAGFKEKSKCLETQYADSREREKNTNDLVMELLERQRELNVMLNRANIMLNRTQEAMALTSMEFNEIAKALPEPKKAEWADRVSRVNELFKKTGIQDAEVVGLDTSAPPALDSLNTDELKKESEEAFSKQSSIWSRNEVRQPPRVEAELIEEEHPEPASHGEVKFTVTEPEENADQDTSAEEDNLIFEPQRKSWWRKMAG